MKNRILIYPFILMGVFFILTFSCKKDDDSSSAQIPVLTTNVINDLASTTATCGGNITSDGGAAITARGVCWSTGQTPTISDNKTSDGSGTGSFTSAITGLSPSTVYYVRSYATNSAGTGYGNSVTFTTLGNYTIPVLTTNAVDNITPQTATSGGNISSDGGATVTERGVCWSLGQTPTITDSKTIDGAGAGNFSSAITGLTPNTNYYVRAYATNIAGTGYGSAMSFTTIEVFEPILTTWVGIVQQTTATCGGEITSDGNSQIVSRGVCWSSNQLPTIADSKTIDGSGLGAFTSELTNLNPNTTYFVRAYATNSYLTGYGNELSFATSGTVTDIDGNVYNTVTIGTQVWLVENLKTTKYRNGETIPNVTNYYDWTFLTTGAYCDYGNNPENSLTYGRLYNWYSVNDSRNIAPIGWHVPSLEDWAILWEYLGGMFSGGKLKETGTAHWQNPNTGATNESGFTALPGGGRGFYTEGDQGMSKSGIWWLSTQQSSTEALSFSLSYNDDWIRQWNSIKYSGFSIRCVKD